MTENTNCQDIALQRLSDSKIEKLIAELCPEGVEFKELGEVADVCSGATPASGVAAYWENGTIPWMSSGEVNKETIYDTEKKIAQAGYDSCSTKMVQSNTVVVALAGQGKTRGKVARTRIPLCTNQSLCAIISNKALDSDFLYYFLKTQYQQLRRVSAGDGGRGGLNLQMIRDYRIPVPPLAIQQEIAKILDTFATLEAKLEAELEARKQQYEYYRDELLTFGDDVEWKTLGEVYEFQYGEGNTIPTSGGEYPVYGSNGVVGSHSNYNSEDAPVIGHIGAYAGIVNWAPGKHFVTYNGVICRIKKSVNPRFGYHLLKKQNLRALAKDGSQPFVSYDKLKSVNVQVPKNDKQIELARILDKFDALVNDISDGLPAELNARRKQYEYYRNKLLTFEPLEKAYAKQ